MQDKIHYLVDGYNLLFRTPLISEKKSLEEARSSLIHHLDAMAEALSLSITVIFDAPFQSDDLRRSHFYALEIVFTAKGQTADDYIVEYVEQRDQRKQVTVITSDKRLGARVKGPKVSVVGVKEFLQKLSKQKQKKKPIAYTAKAQKKELPKPTASITYDPDNLPPLSNIDVWEKIFLGIATSKKKV